MKQLRKTEWQKGYIIKKNLALCAWVLMLLAGFAGILSHPENIPSLVACVLALAGAGLTLPRLIDNDNLKITNYDHLKFTKNGKF